jgi:hypothetical protein
MALSVEDLAFIDVVLAPEDADASVFAAIRQRFPHLSFTRCDPQDVDSETPARRYSRWDLYLVDGSEHCWRLTADPARATGLVVAPRAGGKA